MKELILTAQDQIGRGLAAGANVEVPPFRRIITMGMGGSSMAGEMLSMVHDDVLVHWDYGLPKAAQGGDLVICTSWSGNTEETLSVWQAAREMGLDTLAIVSGGKLADMAKEAGTPLVELEHSNNSPRVNAIEMASAMLSALGLADQVPSRIAMDEMETEGRELAAAIGGHAPAIYTSYQWRKLTGFWKNVYSETVKRQVMTNWFPSAAHVEVVGWEGPYQDMFAPILMRNTDDEAPRYTKNFEALLAILKKEGYNVLTVRLSGNTLLEKVFNNYLLSLWTSYYAAVGLGVDPIAIDLLKEFKAVKREKAQELESK